MYATNIKYKLSMENKILNFALQMALQPFMEDTEPQNIIYLVYISYICTKYVQRNMGVSNIRIIIYGLGRSGGFWVQFVFYGTNFLG